MMKTLAKYLRVSIPVLVVFVLGPGVISAQPPPLADCMICQGCFDGLACCTGTDAGFADCFQQTFGCGTYGGPCFQGGGAPDGTLDLSQVAVSQGSYPISPIGGVSDSDEKGITIRRSCDGAILHRRYKEEVQRSQAALTAYIKI